MSIKIRNKCIELPIIQGGMGVGISLSRLAGNMAGLGGMGVISAAHPGYAYPGFKEDVFGTNFKAIKEEIQKAKQIAKGKGLVGVNIMSKNTPKTFIWHTYEDRSVPVQNSLLYVNALVKAGVPVEFHLFPKGEHGLGTATDLSLSDDGRGVQIQCGKWMDLAKAWIDNNISGDNEK